MYVVVSMVWSSPLLGFLYMVASKDLMGLLPLGKNLAVVLAVVECREESPSLGLAARLIKSKYSKVARKTHILGGYEPYSRVLVDVAAVRQWAAVAIVLVENRPALEAESADVEDN